MKIINKFCVNSTNEYIKKYIKYNKNIALFTKIQPKGKGTKGRSFICKRGGMYVSSLIFFKDLKADESFKLMVQSSMAVVTTLKSINIDCGIKWPNDIYANGKKICGILIENRLNAQGIHHSIIGCGINVNNKIDKILRKTATSVREILGKKINLKDFKKRYLDNLINISFDLETYKSNLLILDKTVTVLSGNEVMKVKVLDVNSKGELVVQSSSGIKNLSSAQISVRL